MRLTLIPLALLCLLASCAPGDLDAFAERHTTAAERAYAERYLDLLADARLDSAAALLAPTLRADSARFALQAVSSVLRDARLDSLHFIGVNVSTNARSGSRYVNLSYELPTTRGRWVSASVAIHSARGDTSVIGFSGHMLRGRLEEMHAFTLTGKSPKHYLWLGLAGLMPLVTLAMAIRLIRAKGMPRRRLWAFAALIASPAFTLNWTTGQGVMSNSLFILFGGAAMRAGPAAPWLVSFAVPIGAFVAYLRLKAWRTVRAAPVSMEPPRAA